MERPTAEEVRGELERTEYKRRFRRALRDTAFTLVVVAAVAILVATLLLPVLRTYGGSMSPTLEDGNIVFSLKTANARQGDIIAFYYHGTNSDLKFGIDQAVLYQNRYLSLNISDGIQPYKNRRVLHQG